jgi:hypothetical protein
MRRRKEPSTTSAVSGGQTFLFASSRYLELGKQECLPHHLPHASKLNVVRWPNIGFYLVAHAPPMPQIMSRI